MTNHDNRGRITVRPLGTSYWSRPDLQVSPCPAGWEIKAEVERDNGSRGWLIYNQRVDKYCLWTGSSLQSVPDRKVRAALEAMGVANAPTA